MGGPFDLVALLEVLSKEAGRKVKASEGDPQYLVKSDKSGGEAAHKPGALKQR